MSTTSTEHTVTPGVEITTTPTSPVAPTRDPIGEMLEQSADYIDKHGWIQHGLKNYRGAVCAIGAVESVLYPDDSVPGLDAGALHQLRYCLKVGRASRRIRKALGLSRWTKDPISSDLPILRHIPVGFVPLIGDAAAVVEWNDSRSTTQQDVVRGLREAAAKI